MLTSAAPLRSLLSMLLACYIYAFGPSSPFYGGYTRGLNPSYSASGWGGDALKNRVMFTFAFFEMIVWFWVWVTLREERAEVVERLRRNDKRD